jgi:hypothetical protein
MRQPSIRSFFLQRAMRKLRDQSAEALGVIALYIYSYLPGVRIEARSRHVTRNFLARLTTTAVTSIHRHSSWITRYLMIVVREFTMVNFRSVKLVASYSSSRIIDRSNVFWSERET